MIYNTLYHLLDVLEAFNLNDPEARHMQLPCPIWVDLYVQFLSILTQKVPTQPQFMIK